MNTANTTTGFDHAKYEAEQREIFAKIFRKHREETIALGLIPAGVVGAARFVELARAELEAGKDDPRAWSEAAEKAKDKLASAYAIKLARENGFPLATAGQVLGFVELDFDPDEHAARLERETKMRAMQDAVYKAHTTPWTPMAHRCRDDVLNDFLKDEDRRGVLEAEVVLSAYGPTLRYQSGLHNFGVIIGARGYNRTPAEFVAAAKAWRNEDPKKRKIQGRTDDVIAVLLGKRIGQ